MHDASNMHTITSVSGGKTSAYLAAHYPSDHLLFALVRIEDPDCLFPDKKIRQLVEDRIQQPFIATAEDDQIIYTMLDLEQYLGREIQWVSGITYDEVIRTKGGWLPNKLHRYCTTHLKIAPMFYWWAKYINNPVTMQIGFRANEGSRVRSMHEKLNVDGLLEFDATFGKHTGGRHDGLNKWESIAWQKPAFPLYYDRIYKDAIEEYWLGKPVRFAELNNCVGCFHRNPLLLNYQFRQHPPKMDWFARQEGGTKGYWRSDCTYSRIRNFKPQLQLAFEDFGGCDAGYCV